MAMRVGTELAAAIQAIFREEFRKTLDNTLVTDQFGKTIAFPMNAGGNQIRIFNWRRLSKVTSNLTEGARYTTQESVFSDYMTVSLEQYGAFVQVSEEAMRYIKGDVMQGAKEVLMVQARESVDWRAMRQWALGGLHIRADGDTVFQQGGESQATSATTTVFLAQATPAITGADGTYSGGQVTFVSGRLAGQTFRITNYVSATDTFTIGNTGVTWRPSAMPQAPQADDRFIVTVPEGVVATDVLAGPAGANNILNSFGLLRRYAAEPFTSGPAAGYFGVIVDNEMDIDFQNDADWINANLYVDNTNIKKGRIGRYGGGEFFLTTQPYREDDEGAQTDTGAVRSCLVFGKDGMLKTKVEGNAQGIRITVRGSENLNQEIPRYGSIAWDATTGFREYDARHLVVIQCGATAVAPAAAM